MNRKERRAGVSGAGGQRGSALAEMFGAALAQHQRGALAEAERRYRYLLTLFPKHADSLHNLGLIVLNGGNATAAIDLFERALAISDRTAEYHYNTALAWRALNRADKVAACAGVT